MKIAQNLFHGLALAGAPGNGGDFGPEAAFFRFVDDRFDFHGCTRFALPML
jgi:hypothetical protein